MPPTRLQHTADPHSWLYRSVALRLSVPVGVQFVHGRWVAAGDAAATGTAATASAPAAVVTTAAPPLLDSASTTSSLSSSSMSSSPHLPTVSASGAIAEGSISPPSASPSSRLLIDASDSQSSTPDLSPATVRPGSNKAEDAPFPDDLDDLPDWDADRPLSSSSSSSLSGMAPAPPPVGSSSPSISLLSTTSSVSSLSCPPPADEFDELDSIPDFDSPPAPPAAASTRTEESSRTSELLAAKMAQFPDDMTVVELKEIDDQTSTADDNTTDGDTDDDDKLANTQPQSQAQPHTGTAQQAAEQSLSSFSQPVEAPSGVSAVSSSSASRLSLCAPSADSSSSVVSRLHNRLLRVSMGSVEQFPADIDELPDDSKPPLAQPTAASAATNPKPSLTSPSSHSLSGVSSWMPLTPASSAPSARALNEFALPDSLVQLFEQQETAHTACNTAHSLAQQQQHAAHTESKDEQLMQHSRVAIDEQPVLSRELQLRFIIAQAESAQHRTMPRAHQPHQPPPHTHQPAASKAVIRNSSGSHSSAAGGTALVETARAALRVPSAAPARKKDGWTATHSASNHS